MFRTFCIIFLLVVLFTVPVHAQDEGRDIQFPASSILIIAATVVLMILNYQLLYRKIDYIADIACVVLMSFFYWREDFFPFASFLISLIFATMRLMVQHDVPLLIMGVVPGRRKVVVGASICLVFLLWCTMLFWKHFQAS